jgi:hypothetical protein
MTRHLILVIVTAFRLSRLSYNWRSGRHEGIFSQALHCVVTRMTPKVFDVIEFTMEFEKGGVIGYVPLLKMSILISNIIPVIYHIFPEITGILVTITVRLIFTSMGIPTSFVSLSP